MSPYRILQLDIEELLYVERNGAIGEIEEEALKEFINLTSNLPRIDRSIRNAFGLNKLTVEERINDTLQSEDEINKIKLERKIKAALRLKELGYYRAVAEVKTETGIEAVHLTMNINKYWSLLPDARVKCINLVPNGHYLRSTYSYDIVERFGDPFLLLPLGIVDLSLREYTNELV